jgi:hypothetical protein
MKSFALIMVAVLVVFSSCGKKSTEPTVQDVDLLTLVKNINANMDKIHKFSADFTLRETNPVDTTRNAQLYFAVGDTAISEDTIDIYNPINSFIGDTLDTVVFSLQQDGASSWIHNSTVLGSGGQLFPDYKYAFMQTFMADSFYHDWYMQEFPTFNAEITYQDADSVVVHQMKSSYVFDYTVDKKRWLVTRIVSSGWGQFDISYTWGRTSGGIYYPIAVKLNAVEFVDDGLVDTVYQFSNIKVNGTSY